ncbi:methylaspartate mutase accessory protein GlmL [Acetomicrobium sp. UBA5826]|uniref:methylaspartate mutase accessory protein GlmL n=1 Tax=Acetomicrobium sp. UBA5826 TaxID=1946039 RepID=UPI00257BBCEF|nr:methylaspartate mutase accessory protein GlmL [Acetomicrobium sp. UBA5826]
MDLTLLIDFGSTYTKVTAISEQKGCFVATAKAPSTVNSDVMIGLSNAINNLKDILGEENLSFRRRVACSSAAGGLRMIAIGLVPTLTVEAARKAALNAGAKLIGSYAFKLTEEDLKELCMQKPDIILLAGGTDGGDEEVILHNAKVLASLELNVPIVVAGNRACKERIRQIFITAGKDVRITENVLPEINRLNIQPARECIREVFIERIVHAKGIDKAKEFVEGILMPTPEAVLRATELLAEGAGEETGMGEILVVDVGGATTDVYTVCSGNPTRGDVILKGLPEPYSKRTVEGDLGVRFNCLHIMETVGVSLLSEMSGMKVDVIESTLSLWARKTYMVPKSELEINLDQALARCAVDIAVKRHSGTLEKYYTPMGEVFVQYGKDLTSIKAVVGTGGPLVNAQNPTYILSGALFDEHDPSYLKPKNPKLYIDKNYIFYAIGLLAEINPELAIHILKQDLKQVSCEKMVDRSLMCRR